MEKQTKKPAPLLRAATGSENAVKQTHIIISPERLQSKIRNLMRRWLPAKAVTR